MLFFLIGVSGVGKSVIRQHLATNFSLLTFDLDCISYSHHIYSSLSSFHKSESLPDLFNRIGADRFFEYGRDFLVNWELMTSPTVPIIIDVGAGFLHSSYAHNYLSKKKVFHIYTDDSISYGRYFNRSNGMGVISQLDHIDSCNFIRLFCADLKYCTYINAALSPDIVANSTFDRIKLELISAFN